MINKGSKTPFPFEETKERRQKNQANNKQNTHTQKRRSYSKINFSKAQIVNPTENQNPCKERCGLIKKKKIQRNFNRDMSGIISHRLLENQKFIPALTIINLINYQNSHILEARLL